MADEKQEDLWPLPSFHFMVKIGDWEITFQEVSGLDTEFNVIDYRALKSNQFSVVKMPGFKKITEITLKKGKFKNNTALINYFTQSKMSVSERKTVIISLLDEAAKTSFVWTLTNAMLKKVTGASINSQTNDTAVEEIVLNYEGITMETK